MKQFVKECILAFRKVKPSWMPPHLTVFRVANRLLKGTKVTINGKDIAFWTPQRLFDMVDTLDARLNRLTVKVGDSVCKFKWLDCGKIEEEC